MQRPMLTYYDFDLQMNVVPKGVVISPSNMQGYGPQNLSQLQLGMSQAWMNDKIKGKLSSGNGPFHEWRDVDSSPDAVESMNGLYPMLADREYRQRLMEALERDYGLPILSNPEAARTIINQNINSTLNRGQDGQRFVDATFGDPRLGKTHHDLLCDTILPFMEDFHRGTPMEKGLGPWQFKARHGMTDAQFWAVQFQCLEEQRAGVQELTANFAHHAMMQCPQPWAQQLGNFPVETTLLRPSQIDDGQKSLSAEL